MPNRTKPLELAAAQGHQEAIFLKRHFGIYTATPAPRNHGITISMHFQDTFGRNEDPRAIKYALLFSYPENRDINLLLQLAEAGNAILQYMIGQHYDLSGNVNEAVYWHRKAAEQDFAPSVYALWCLLRAQKVPGMQCTPFLLRAAELGYRAAISTSRHQLQLNYLGDISLETMIRLETRIITIEPWRDDISKLTDMVKYANARLRKDGIGKVFVIGQLLDEWYTYHPDVGNKTLVALQPAVGIYRRMTSRVRHATMQTILVLRSLGVCRDIAILISKLVYASRAETSWYTSNLQK